MHFRLVDQVLERTADRVVAIKNVTIAEEYLQDHFPSFPVLPGVFMLEALVQTARELLAGRGCGRVVLGQVKGLKYGSFVRPGDTLRMDVTFEKDVDGGWQLKGLAEVIRPEGGAADTACTGRLMMRPVRIPAPAGG
jgi:3-hydroxyacyl-[acyl-carrier-protein] dehydratase